MRNKRHAKMAITISSLPDIGRLLRHGGNTTGATVIVSAIIFRMYTVDI
jgi:hypothetical protein